MLALAAALAWAFFSVTPPAARGLDAPATAFSAARAMVDVVEIARHPHPLGSPEDARVQRWLTSRLLALGADLSTQSVPLDAKSLNRLAKWRGTPVEKASGTNIIGVLPGRDRSLPAVMLMAHHDSVWGSPGAADDAAGLASAIEVTRAIRARGGLQRDLILLFTDGEEIGLDGAEIFFRTSPLAAHVGVIVNMEARGAGGRANMFETGPGNGAMMRLYADAVDRPATHSLSVLVYDRMPNYTDYTVAKKRGIPGFNLALLDRAWTYHSPLATPATLDRGALQDMGDQALALAAALTAAPVLPPKTESAAFGDLLGRVTIAYPASLGWIPLLAAAGLLAIAALRAPPGWRQVVAGAVVTLALLLHGALLLIALNALSGSGHADYYDRLAALPRLEVQAGLAIVALVALLPLFHGRNPRLMSVAPALALMWLGLLLGGSIPLVVGIAIGAALLAFFLPAAGADRWGATWLLLAASLIVQLTLPTAAPLFVWPLLLAAFGLAAGTFLRAPAALAMSAVLAAAGLGHLAAQAHFVMLAVGAALPAVLMVWLFAGLPLLWPLLPVRPAPRLAIGLLAIAAGIALWVALDPIAPSIPTYSLAEGGGKTRE